MKSKIYFLLLLGIFVMVNQNLLTQTKNVEERVNLILSKMTLEEKIDMIGGFEDFHIMPIERLGIPKIKMADGPLGVRNYGDATAFPAGICVSATWNTDLMYKVGAAVGTECRSKGVHIILAPGVNIYRAPMAGRNFEYYGEDPYLSARMTVNYIKGVQDQGVIATVKHYAANNQEWDRHNISSDIDERTLREIYLPAFQAAVEEAKVGSVMNAYNLINGVHCSENKHILLDILKGDWKFDGFVMSDWGSTYSAIDAANNGLDLEMPSGRFMNRKNLMPAIDEGKVQISTIDDKIKRILRVIIRMGFLDRQQYRPELPLYNPDSRLVALEAAREGIVLLRNENNLLPLDRKKIKSIAIIGPNAYPAVTGGGGSSLVKPFRAVSPLEGFIDKAGEQIKVYYAPGILKESNDLFETANFQTPSLTDPQKMLSGLKGEYYDNPDFSGKPVTTRIDKQIDFNISNFKSASIPDTNISIRWTGKIKSTSKGEYIFAVRGDDGYRLYINDEMIIDGWFQQPPTTRLKTMHLEADKSYNIKLEYYQAHGGAEIKFGYKFIEVTPLQEAQQIAAKVDAVILCIGFNSSTETEGADRTFNLPAGQEELINSIANINKNTIVALTAGGNIATENWLRNVPAFLTTWYPGQEGGTALAEIVFGDINPSGKLPATFEKRWEDNPVFNSYYSPDDKKAVKYSEGIFVGYRGYEKNNIKPLFPFGYGLSYTTFSYSNLKLSSKNIKKGEELKVSVEVENKGLREGKEVVQLYIHSSKSSVQRPLKELKDFYKVDLKPKEKKTITFTVKDSALSFYDTKINAWVAEPGEYNILIGSSSQDIILRDSFILTK
jgi:beta-glucosidase